MAASTPAHPRPGQMFSALWHGLEPVLPLLIPLMALLIVATTPLPGRGPVSRKRDPWRTFKFEARRAVMDRAEHRCEAAAFVFFGRCSSPAVEADHIYPWSKGGGTVVSNGQALCKAHNRSKSNMTPPWWYVMLLERRRRGYVLQGVSGRVSGALSKSERAHHQGAGRARRS